MNVNRGIATVVFVLFAGLCAVVLVRRESVAGGAWTPAVAASARAVGRDGSPLSLLLVSSLAKRTFVDKAVLAFNERHERVGEKVVVITVRHGTSGDGWDDIKEGRCRPDLWSPGDESWIRIANERWRGLHNVPLFSKFEPLVNVPLVIAMWEPMAVALGHPKPLGWSDLARLSADPEGWGRYGHPEWGRFKWGHAHPDAASGFLAVMAEVYALTKKAKHLTVQDLKEPSLLSHMTELEQSAEHYGLSSPWIENYMREKGPAYLSATVQYENGVIEGNQRTRNKPFKIVAIYPREGTFSSQHPIAIPDADWVTEEHRAGARKFIDYLLTSEVQKQAMDLGLRPLAGVRAGEPFNAAFGVATELPPSPNFEMPSEEVLRRVKDLWLSAKKPASIMMLLDTSASMSGEPMDKAKAGALAFIENMQDRDELEIRSFNERSFQLSSVETIAKGGEAARQKVRGLFASGGTHLYEALKDAASTWNDRKHKWPDRHYGIVLLSDGQDEGSAITLADLLDALPKGDSPETIKIFTIPYGAQAGRTLLQEIAHKSNARAFESSTDDIGRVYQELSANF